MSAQFTISTPNARNHGRTRLAIAILGAVLVSTAAVGVATWHSAGQRKGADAAWPSQPIATTAATAGAERSGLASPTTGYTVYLVASEEDARFLREHFAAVHNPRAAIGSSPDTAEVLVIYIDAAVPTEELPHAPGTTFIDLRGGAMPSGIDERPAVTMAPGSADALAIVLDSQGQWVAGPNPVAAAGQARRSPPGQVVYLVDSAEDQRALTDVGLGADTLVLVATTDEDAAQIRAGLGRPGVTVVDLRRHAVGAASRCGPEIDAQAC